MELIVTKRFSNVQFYGSYVLSKLYGNFQGSFRSDNGQQDPNISSMFDFTNSDGVLTGQDIPGVLNSDRRHQFKLFGNYMWQDFNVGASWLPTSGTPITDLLAHPAYVNAGEIPVCPGRDLHLRRRTSRRRRPHRLDLRLQPARRLHHQIGRTDAREVRRRSVQCVQRAEGDPRQPVVDSSTAAQPIRIS